MHIETGKCCSPDLTLFVRTVVDRVYFLLLDAYGRDEFRQLFGKLFECYIDRLDKEFAGIVGPGRTYLRDPRFLGTQDQAADGILLWDRTAAVMEYKGGLLTTRHRYAGFPDETLRGIESLVNRVRRKGKKGIPQLASNIARLISNESRVVSDGDEFDLSRCTTVYPMLICYDESFGIHAVTRYLQKKLNEELAMKSIPVDKVGPLMLLTVRDFEALATAGQSVSIKQLLHAHAKHLAFQKKDFTGTFSSVVSFKFGKQIDWQKSLTYQKHCAALGNFGGRFK